MHFCLSIAIKKHFIFVHCKNTMFSASSLVGFLFYMLTWIDKKCKNFGIFHIYFFFAVKTIHKCWFLQPKREFWQRSRMTHLNAQLKCTIRLTFCHDTYSFVKRHSFLMQKSIVILFFMQKKICSWHKTKEIICIEKKRGEQPYSINYK